MLLFPTPLRLAAGGAPYPPLIHLGTSQYLNAECGVVMVSKASSATTTPNKWL